MKLSKTAFSILGIGVFIIAFVALFVIYLGQSEEQERLNDSLIAAQNLLPRLIAERQELEDQVAQGEGEVAKAQSALNKSEARFPKSVESIENDETLFLMADKCDLRIWELTASEPETEEVESEEVEDIDITYAVTTFEVVVRSKESLPSQAGDFGKYIGDFEMYVDELVDNVLDLIHIIATSEEFNIATIELVAIENLEPQEEAEEEEYIIILEEEEEEEEMPEATIKIVIYGYPR